MDEKTFLESYDSRAFEGPLICFDSVLFTYHENTLKVLMVKRSNHPDKGMWSLPGGFVDTQEDRNLEEAALRKLKEKTKVIPPYLEQLTTVGDSSRDKRGWSITICYTALVAHQSCEAGVDAVSDAQWMSLDQLNKLETAFDHKSIIKLGRERLRQKALYSIIPAYALPETFTFPELQHLHEILIGKALQKKSFRRRIEQADLLIDTQKKRSEGGRPAALYRIKAGSQSFRFVRNLEE